MALTKFGAVRGMVRGFGSQK